MPLADFLIIFAICAGSIIIFRVVPMFALTGRELPAKVENGLSYIPVAAFAALVANDLFKPEVWAAGDPWSILLPFIAAIPVVLVAVKWKSLALCIIVGCVAYALLLLV